MNENIPNNSIVIIANYNRDCHEITYSAMHLTDNTILFYRVMHGECSANVVALIAIVDTLSHCSRNNITDDIYINNQCAISWFENKRIRTSLSVDSPIYKVFDRAVEVISTECFQNNVLKWNTQEWGPVSELFNGYYPP